MRLPTKNVNDDLLGCITALHRACAYCRRSGHWDQLEEAADDALCICCRAAWCCNDPAQH